MEPGRAPVIRPSAAAVEAVIANDLKEISAKLGDRVERLAGKEILVTGCAGFIGYYLLSTIAALNDSVLKGRECACVGLDNFMRGRPAWLDRLAGRKDFTVVKASVMEPTAEALAKAGWRKPVRFIVHAATIASPTFYRQHPIETMDANVIGLRNILDFAVNLKATPHPLESLLFFSSSEIYGDPPPDKIPTDEAYWGNVSCTGPRACYDESKRYGETLCVNFHKVHGTPVKVARPFNNYGPGLGLQDRRVIPDIVSDVLAGKNIVLLSSGAPTRTFCYIADAIAGYMQILLSDENGEAFNIGAETPEITIHDLASTILRLAEKALGITGLKLEKKPSDDPLYLTHNPQRRCPTITKARSRVGFEPTVPLEEGLRRSLIWYGGTA